MRKSSIRVCGFQSTLSMRRATKTFAAKRYGIKISIHALHEESDVSFDGMIWVRPFQSTLSMRRATRQATGLDTMTVFQSTLSMRRATVVACIAGE